MTPVRTVADVVKDFPTLQGQCDEEADALVGATIKVGLDPADALQEFGQFMRTVSRDPARQDDKDLNDFLMGGPDIAATPEDKDRIRTAQQFFEDNGVAIISALFYKALPEAYLGRRGVQVLDLTGELFSDFRRRIAETGRFLLNVLTPALSPNGDATSLDPGQPGAIAVRRVRLIHAAIRRLIPRDEWQARLRELGDPDAEPINQVDLLATLTTFTTMTFEALELLGTQVGDAHKDAYHYLWRAVGEHLGIQPRNIPATPEEMAALTRHVREQLQGPTEQGERMAKALVQELTYPLPRALHLVTPFTIRYLIGDDMADSLGIEQGGYTELLVRRSGLLAKVAEVTRKHQVSQVVVGAASDMLTRYTLRAFLAESRHSDRGLQIEPRIAARWGIQIGPETRPPMFERPG